MAKVKAADMPELLKPHLEVRGKKRRLRGVYLKGCVARGEGSSFWHAAHAHTGARDPHRGWVCIRKASRITEERLLIHELAHILTRQGHTQKWRDKFVELGGDPAQDGAFINREAFLRRQAWRDQVKRAVAAHIESIQDRA